MSKRLNLFRCVSEDQPVPAPRTAFENVFRRRRFFIVFCLSLALACLGLTPLALADQRNSNWVTGWDASPTPGGTFFSPGCPSDVGLNNQTVRNLVFLTAGGPAVRVRISNAGGSNPLAVGAATVAIAGAGAGIVQGSLRPLSFGGQPSINIAAGGEVWSDPVPLAVRPGNMLSVSVYLPGATGLATQHFFAAQDNFLASGDQTGTADPTAFNQKISCWMFLSGVDVKTWPDVFGTLVFLGDSITDGFLSTANANRRFPDVVARRLAMRKGPTLSVANAGIIGNELLTNRPQLQFGFAAPSRLARDVLTQTAARAVVLLEGINDIGDKSAKAEDLIAVDKQIILQAHISGLKIYGGTLVPFGGSNGQYGGDYGTPAGEAERQKLNNWIRTSGAFDGVVDFDKAVRDLADPTRLLPAFDGDHLHPNDAGYQAMGNAVNIDQIINDLLRGARHGH